MILDLFEPIKIAEIAKRLDVSIYTVKDWIRTKKLPAFKKNGIWHVEPSVFDDFLRAYRYD